jgi:hypothetical protein
LLESLLDGKSEFGATARFYQKPINMAFVNCAQGGIQVRVARQDHSDAVRKGRGNHSPKIGSRLTGHHFIGDNDIDFIMRQYVQGVLCRGGAVDDILFCQMAPERFGDQWFIIDQKN